MKITSWDQAEHALADVRQWYIARIGQAAAAAGGHTGLSRRLGHTDDYTQKIQDHGSLQQQRKLVREIENKSI